MRMAASRRSTRAPVIEVSQLGQHHDLAPRAVVFHAAMRFRYFVKSKDSADLHVKFAFRDLLSELLQWSKHEIFRATTISRQVHRCRDLVYRIEIRDRPLVADHAGHAHDP